MGFAAASRDSTANWSRCLLMLSAWHRTWKNPSIRFLTNGWRMVHPWSIQKNCLVTPSSTRKHRKPWRVSCKRGTETSTHLSSQKNVKKRWSWYWCTENAAKRCHHSIPPSTELLMNCFTKWHGDDSDLISSNTNLIISPPNLGPIPFQSKLLVVSKKTKVIGKKWYYMGVSKNRGVPPKMDGL